MIIQIEVEGHIIPFRLDPEHSRWHSLVKQKEGDFPLIAESNGKRIELYSDGTFAEVKR